MNKNASLKAEQRKLKQAREEELRQLALEQKARKKKFYITSAIFLAVVIGGLAWFISYMNEDLLTATDLFKDKNPLMQSIADSLNEYCTDKSVTTVTIHYETQKNTNGEEYRVSILNDDKTYDFYAKPEDVLNSALSQSIDSVFVSTVGRIIAIRQDDGYYTCTFREETGDYLGTVFYLTYTTDGERFINDVSDQYILKTKYSENWYYYQGFGS